MSSYEFIKDLPDNWNELASPDLKRMHKFWLRAKKQFEENNSEELRTFNSQLAREWSIETGIIENIYSINRGITQTLIEKGIQESYIQHGSTDKPAEIIVPILNAQKNALEMAFSFIKNERKLSSSFIKELHAAITQHQDTTITKDVFGTIKEVPLRRGDWKLLPNNPTRSDGTVFFYCPPEHVAAEIDRLLEMHINHQNEGIAPEIEAAWLHHRFAQIHPFQDGNGRVARVLASLVMIRANLFPVIIYREQRSEYIDALEEADSGDLVKLIGLLSQNQMRAARQAIKFVETSVPEPILLEKDEIEVIIKSGVEARRRKKKKSRKSY